MYEKRNMKARSAWFLVVVFAAVVVGRAPGQQPTAQPEIATPATRETPRRFILGADISWVQQQEDEGTRFSDQGARKDVLEILQDHGFHWIRLRIFHHPQAEKGYSRKGYCDLQHTVQMAKRVKAAGMGLLLDFHYSDTWADPCISRSRPRGATCTART